MGIVENIKDAADLAKRVGDIELYRKIVHLEGEVMDLTREKRQAEQKVEELQKQLQLKAKMTFNQPFYYQEGDTVPFCPRCYEKDVRAIHLFHAGSDPTKDRWDCRECDKMYWVEHGRTRPTIATSPHGPWS